jgi:hypothetical protein
VLYRQGGITTTSSWQITVTIEKEVGIKEVKKRRILGIGMVVLIMTIEAAITRILGTGMVVLIVTIEAAIRRILGIEMGAWIVTIEVIRNLMIAVEAIIYLQSRIMIEKSIMGIGMLGKMRI